MKFQSVNELEHFSFEDSEIQELQAAPEQLTFTLSGALVKAGNSQNGRYQDMYCGTLVLRLEHVKIARIVKEGFKYYDADGRLLREVPDEDVPEQKAPQVLDRCKKGRIFTAVEDTVESGYAWEFGIDVPREEDEEEVDTFWLCLLFESATAMWERYCSPAESS